MTPFYISSWNLLCFTLTLILLLRGIEGQSCWESDTCYHPGLKSCQACDQIYTRRYFMPPTNERSSACSTQGANCCATKSIRLGVTSYYNPQPCADSAPTCPASCKSQEFCVSGTFYETDASCTSVSTCGAKLVILGYIMLYLFERWTRILMVTS